MAIDRDKIELNVGGVVTKVYPQAFQEDTGWLNYQHRKGAGIVIRSCTPASLKKYLEMEEF